MTTMLQPASATLPAPPATAAPDVLGLLERVRRRGLAALAVWAAVAIAWSVWAPISGAVVGSGLVKVEANRQTITHRDGGIVAKVLVREGQKVTTGQTLVVLEDVRLDSSVELLEAQLAAELLRRSRLEAETAQAANWSPPQPKIAGKVDPTRLREAVQRERAAFDARRRTLHGQLAAIRTQIADTEAEMAARERDAKASTGALALLNEELEQNEALLKDNFVNKARVLTIKRGIAEYESRVEGAQAERLQARGKRTELEGRLQAVVDAYVQTAALELREVSARVVDFEEKVRSGRDTAGRQVVVAPSDGRLVDLKVNTPGSAIGPREPIVDIVPSNVPLVIEARVAADAISDVRPGLEAEVRLLAYRQRNTAMLLGKVTNVSADALVEPRSGAPYFAVHVEVSPQALAKAGQLELLPGMAAEVFIKTAERSVLEFLLDPLTAAMRRSFREH